MSSVVYVQGAAELVTLTNTFSVAGTATDPTTVSLSVTTPAGVATTYTYAAAQITKTGTGVYTKSIACSEAGTWSYVWTGTGPASDVQSGTWEVFESTLGNLYVSPDVLKSRLGITDTEDDFEISQACFAASRSIEMYCERTFYRTAAATVRTFEAEDCYRLIFGPFNDLVSVSALATDEASDGLYSSSWTAPQYQLRPLNPSAAPEPKPYTELRAFGRSFPVARALGVRSDLVQVTGVWGWPSVPMGVRMGSVILSEELFRLKDAAFGVAGFGEFGAVRVRDNPKVAKLVNPYRYNPIKVG